MSWEDRAECSNHDPADWYPPKSAGRAKTVAASIAICRKQCPVRSECAEYALVSGRRNGIWGGVDLGDNPVGKPGVDRIAELTRVAEGAQ